MTALDQLASLDFSTAPESADELAALFKALGDPLRVGLLRIMHDDSFSVSELCELFELRQSALSHHLKILVNAGWLTRRREGTAIYYRRQLPAGPDSSLRREIIDAIDGHPLPEDHKARLTAVQQNREQNSLAFFRDNVERFREQQDLIASWEDYSAASLHMLDSARLPTNATLLELGPGDGRLLPELARRAAQVIALDNSPTMLESAKSANTTKDNIRFVLGDTAVALAAGLSADGVVINMVLHHTADPQSVLAEAGQLLSPGGVMVISELCAHDQGWAREHCGDLWLGFEPGQLARWADSAGLESRGRLFITQRNGFQIQVQLFQRTQDERGTQA